MTSSQLLDWAHVAALLTAYAGLAWGIYKGLRMLAGPTLQAMTQERAPSEQPRAAASRPLATELA